MMNKSLTAGCVCNQGHLEEPLISWPVEGMCAGTHNCLS